MSVLAIFNPISGAGRARIKAQALAEAAERRGMSVELQPTQPTPAEIWLRPILARGSHRAIVVIGGDGTVHLVAPEAARAEVPLVHCPQGNENLFAREFGMSADPEPVLDLLDRGRPRPVDLLNVSIPGRPSEIAVIMASIGFDAQVVHDLAARRTGTVSHLSYLRPILRSAIGLSLPTITAMLDGETIAESVPGMIVVGNSRQYASRIDPASRAKMDDGLLDVVIMPCRSVMGVIGWIARCRFGRHLRHPDLIYRQGRTLDLRVTPGQAWQVDGDPPHDRNPVSEATFSVLPHALAVLEPAPAGVGGTENPESG